MDSLDKVSDSIKRSITERLARGENESLLSGQGSGRAFKVTVEGRDYVLKQSPQNFERLFYKNIAKQVNEAEVLTPKLYLEGESDSLSWILIEYIPNSLPKERWRDDEEVIATVAKLHELKPQFDFLYKNNPRHAWSDDLIESAIELWDKEDQIWLKPLFEEIRHMYKEFFSKEFFVSGDPNGGNWGVNNQGELVLFDWERVGYSDPATDLMGIAFGEPKQEVFNHIAKLYLKHSKVYHSSVKELARKIQIGRVHITLAITKDLIRDESHIDPRVRQMHREIFPKWLKETFTGS